MVANNKSLATNPPAFATLRYKTASEYPYFSSIIFMLVPVESPDCPTFAVDNYWRLYYNPDLLKSLPLDQAVACLVHEVNHVLREHWARMGDREPFLWNLAGDLPINCDIRKAGMTLPDFVVYPEKFKLPEGLTQEQYYDELIKKATKIKISKGLGAGQCGSCAGENKKDHPWEIPGEGPGGMGEAKDKDGNPVPKVDHLNQELARRETAKSIIEHSKSRGSTPDSLVRWAKEKLKSKVNWQKEMRSVINNAANYISGMVDYTRSKISRRQSAFKDVMMYGFHAPVPNVAVIIDTSGSMGDKDLGQAVAETAKILKQIRSKVTVLACDAAVGNVQKINHISQVKLTGGGGTDMPEGFKAAALLHPKPDMVICITDGETSWPQNIYKFPCFAVLTRKSSRSSVPKWIKVLPAYQEEAGDEEE